MFALLIIKMEKIRCDWVTKDEVYQKYHDEEWGVPLHDDQALFEMICLEGFQAGLSWLTILKRRDNFRLAFDFFDPVKMSLYDDKKINELLQNEGIIRNRQKIEAAIHNAKCFLKVKKREGSFSDFIWSVVDHKPVLNKRTSIKDFPVRTELSDKLSEKLKKEGFKFIGTVTCYAFMQAAGLVNDHLTYCFCYKKGR
jgi:DNA-3-methyladenine glycosylase I